MPLKGSNYLVMIILSLLLVSLYGLSQPTFTTGVDKSHSHTALDGDGPLINSSGSKKLPADDFVSLKKLIRKPHLNEKLFSTLDKNTREHKSEQTLTKFQMGIEAGPSMTFLWPMSGKRKFGYYTINNGTTRVDYRPKLSFFTGLRLDYRIKRDFTLSGLLSLSSKGSNYTQVTTYESRPNTKEKFEFTANYLSLHILPTKIFGNSLRYKIQGGPYTNLIRFFQTNHLAFSEVGLTAGVGMEIPFAEHWSFDIHLRNSLGILQRITTFRNHLKFPKGENPGTHPNISYLSIGISPEIGSKTISPAKSTP